MLSYKFVVHLLCCALYSEMMERSFRGETAAIFPVASRPAVWLRSCGGLFLNGFHAGRLQRSTALPAKVRDFKSAERRVPKPHEELRT